LARELSIDEVKIRVTSLNKNQQTSTSLQYRISVPECNYRALMTPSTWPKNVRVRDYFFKPRNNGVSKNDFLERETVNHTQDPLGNNQLLINHSLESESTPTAANYQHQSNNHTSSERASEATLIQITQAESISADMEQMD